jgi:LysR family transcriptional regulator, hydrogen peroxide-inducible genes activator
MEMHQIRYFLALCEELNFTRAARRCGVTQPSLTNAIRALETELAGPVFHRKPRIELTQLGRAIRPYLQEIARNVSTARELARTVASSVTPVPPARYHVATNGTGETTHRASHEAVVSGA